VKIRALGEFPRFRGPRAAGEEQLQNAPRDQHASVAGDFHQVFAGVAVRRAKDGEERVVQLGFAVANSAEMLGARRKRRRGRLAQKDAVGHDHRARSAQADHRDRSFANRRGNSCDRVVHCGFIMSAPPANGKPGPRSNDANGSKKRSRVVRCENLRSTASGPEDWIRDRAPRRHKDSCGVPESPANPLGCLIVALWPRGGLLGGVRERLYEEAARRFVSLPLSQRLPSSRNPPCKTTEPGT